MTAQLALLADTGPQTKRCPMCGETKSAAEFYKGDHKDGLHSYCIPCWKERRKGTYLKHRERMLTTQKARKQAKKMRLVELAGGKCQYPGCESPVFPEMLDFHHLDPDSKDRSELVGDYNFGKACAEVDKCILLCANHHRMIEAGRWWAHFVKRDGLGWTIEGEVTTLAKSRPWLEIKAELIAEGLF